MKNLKLITILLLTIFAFSCKKEKSNNPPDAGPIELWSNVRVIDSTQLTLSEDTSLLNTGTYKFTVIGTAPTITTGDIIVGATGDGYIRKVTSVSVSGNIITLQTSQASMANVFKSGKIDFTMDMSDMHLRTNGTGFTYDFNATSLWQDANLNVKVVNGQLNLNPNWFFDFRFNNNGISYFELSSKDGTLNGNITLNVTTAAAVTLLNKEKTIEIYNKRDIKWITVGSVLVPIVIEMDLNLVGTFSVNVSSAINRQLTFNYSNTFNVGAKYLNSEWQGIYDFAPNNSISMNPITGKAGLSVNVNIVPRLNIKIMGVVGPNASIGLSNELKGNIASPSLDWDFNYDAWIKSTIGIKATILDFNIADYNTSWETAKLNYKTPDKLERVSGDNQTGNANQALRNPIKVVVKDSKGNTQANVPVYFTIKSGGGSVNPTSILSDANGNAEAIWTLGASTTTIQYIDVTAKTATGQNINNTPIEFAAVVDTNHVCPNTVKDIDGNVYNVVQIGNQCWMKENLKVSRYRDGTSITTNLIDSIWEITTNGAYAYPNNNIANNNIYGKLYNWYAVNTGKLAPAGWHVPSYGEWVLLVAQLGGELVAGDKMKSTSSLWTPYSGIINTDSSGFSALPAGVRSGSILSGGFYGLGQNAVFWSSTERYIDAAWVRSLHYLDSGAYSEDDHFKNYGLSVRCVKD